MFTSLYKKYKVKKVQGGPKKTRLVFLALCTVSKDTKMWALECIF